MTIKVFEAFAGIGTQRMALERSGIDHEIVAISEIDKYALASYEAIHGPTKNLGDISKIDIKDVPDHDLFIYSFPCTDISLAGQQRGLEKGSGTRSSLLWECERIIEAKRPKYLLMENVKNLASKRFKGHFNSWLDLLEDLGYTNYWEILNAKDYGIPQNRERVFCISIHGQEESFSFPDKKELTIFLKDLLEEEVEEKYFLTEKQIAKIEFKPNKDKPQAEINQIGRNKVSKRNNPNTFRVYDQNHVAPTIGTYGGGNREPMILEEKEMLIKNATKQGYLKAEPGDGIDLNYPNSTTRRGRVQSKIMHTLDTADTKGVLVNGNHGDRLKVRKLTPKECWRLMGIEDKEFEKVQSKFSNAQLYKHAGNAIVVNVLEGIFKNLFKENRSEE